MNLASVRTGLGDRLDTITGVRVYDAIPENAEPPCAVIAVGAGVYDADFDDNLTAEWSVLMLVSRADDVRAQSVLDTYLSTTGSSSVPAAIRSDATLGGSVDSAKVVGWAEPQTYTIADTSYVGVEIQVETVG